MAQQTPRLNLNYPQSSDPANPPSDFQSIANTLDNEVVGYVHSSSTSAPANPYLGLIWYQTDTQNIYYYSGPQNGWMPVSMYYASSTATSPNPTLPGMFWYQTDTNQLKVYNGSQWIESVPAIMASSTAPPTPAYSGMIWYQTDTKQMQVYDGTLSTPGWVTPSSLIYYNATQPTAAAQGQIWFDTSSMTTKIYIGSSWQPISANPPGTIIDYAGQPGGYTMPTGSTASTTQPLTSPYGYMVCDGATLSKTTYANLYNALKGTASSSPWGEATTTFNLPDFRGKVTVGVGGQTSTNTKPAYALAATDGEKTHQLTSSELASHTHSDSGHSHTVGMYYGSGSGTNPYALSLVTIFGPDSIGTSTSYANIQPSGGNAYHQNMQPSVAVYKLIKY